MRRVQGALGEVVGVEAVVLAGVSE
jgi:hypothetical protein